jgi:hypothetical protein
MHLTPAGFPSGMPGMGVEMDGPMQQAPQLGRHFIGYSLPGNDKKSFCSLPIKNHFLTSHPQ